MQPLLDIYLRADETLQACCEDLKDYYYLYSVSNQRSARNAMAWRLTYAEASKFKAFKAVSGKADCYIPSLATMAMGDVNAVEIGQQAHVRLALSLGLQLSDLVTFRGKAPRQNWLVGIIIDDFVVLEKIPRGLKEKGIGASIAELMVAEYRRVGLPNDEKRVTEETYPEFWGIAIDGEDGILRPQIQRVLPIANLTAQVARLGLACRKLLEVLAGSWIAILAARRRGMCILSSIFADIQNHSYDEVFSMAPSTISELWLLTVLAPLFCTDLRAIPSDELSMVDASDSHRAEVASKMSEGFGEELLRHKLTKAAWSKLLSPFRALQRVHGTLDPAFEVPEGEEVLKSHPLWAELAKTLQFKCKQVHSIKQQTHINISELRAAVECEERRARRQPGHRHAIGSDSQVSLGALVKGRSSSAALNGVLRRALPTVLGFNSYAGFQYIPTLLNPGDDPTRHKAVREPTSVTPQWLEDAFAGKFEGLDAFLDAEGVGDAELARLPQAPEIAAPTTAFASVRALQRRAWCKQPRARTGLGQKQFLRPPETTAVSRSPWLKRRRLSEKAFNLLCALPDSQFIWPEGKRNIDALRSPGHLDLFSGSRRAPTALTKKTGCWTLCYDIKNSAREDLLSSCIQKELLDLLEAGCFVSVTGGPVCSSFSRAVCPAVRSSERPEGLENVSAAMKEKIKVGNAMASWLAGFVDAALALKMVVWIENPAGSFLWLLSSWKKVIAKHNLQCFYTDYCAWGAPWRKRTRFYGNFAAAGLKLLCSCRKRHIQLRGFSRQHGVCWTKAAEAYPHSLSRFLALAVYESLKPESRQRKLDVAGCAKAGKGRIGEASNPGPRMRQQQSDTDLEAVHLVQPATRAIQSRAHTQFSTWLSEELGPRAYRRVQLNPHLQLHFVRSFGNAWFRSGGAMYLFRHLVVYLQQLFPAERLVLSGAWDLLARWEVIQPVSHRPPVPRILLNALVALGLSWGWIRWSALTSLAYYGVMRLGEPLRARRRDLLLPEDAGLESKVCFLRVGRPKPGRRGRGKVQHAKIFHEPTVDLVRLAFGGLAPDDFLYPASAGTYRRRWDVLLQTLGVPSDSHVTPGGLRGGGCIYLYHNSTPIQDILWLMRLRHQVTLEHYLQECAAANILQELSAPTRRRIQASSNMLPFLVQTLTS